MISPSKKKFCLLNVGFTLSSSSYICVLCVCTSWCFCFYLLFILFCVFQNLPLVRSNSTHSYICMHIYNVHLNLFSNLSINLYLSISFYQLLRVSERANERVRACMRARVCLCVCVHFFPFIVAADPLLSMNAFK